MKKFLSLPIEQQAKYIIWGAIVSALIAGGVFIFWWFGPSRVIAFALLTMLCVPIGMLYSKLKGSLKNAILTKEDDADGDAA